MRPSPPSSPAGRRWLWLAAWLLLVVAVAALGSLATTPKIPTWYAGLAKPWFTPPSWVFGPAWSVLYALMAIAAWRVADGGGPAAMPAGARWLFFGQLVLNGAWSPAFFGLEAPKTALAIVVALALVLVPTVFVFFRRNRLAGIMLLPYLAWVVFAATLNGAIVMLN